MMPRWHHSDSSKAMSTEHDSVKKKTLELNSRSNLFSAGLFKNKIENATETRKRAWEEDCACQLLSETSLQGSTPYSSPWLHSKTPVHKIHGVYIVGGMISLLTSKVKITITMTVLSLTLQHCSNFPVTVWLYFNLSFAWNWHKTVLEFIVDVDKRLVCRKLQWVLLF